MKNIVLLIDAGHGGITPEGEYTTAPSKQKKFASGYHGRGWFYEGVSNRQIAAECRKVISEIFPMINEL